MTIDILTIFPEMFESVLSASIIGRAREQGLLTIETTDIRPFSASKHKNTDDYPYGGGAGMLMMAQPIADAIKAVCEKRKVPCRQNVHPMDDSLNEWGKPDSMNTQAANDELDGEETNDGLNPEETNDKQHAREAKDQLNPLESNDEADARETGKASSVSVKRIYLSPRGVPLTQKLAQELAKEENLILLCGHYEGVDQRVLDQYIDLEVSIGDYVLTGGELGAMVLADCVARLVPGVLGSEESSQDESFSDAGLLEYPQYTRPRVFEGMEVPEVLLNGDHAKIAAWRRAQSIAVTAQRRPDLLEKASLSEKERANLQK